MRHWLSCLPMAYFLPDYLKNLLFYTISNLTVFLWLHPQTILPVGEHVQDQACRNNSELWKQGHDTVQPNGIVGVEWVKANAAPAGVKNGVGQQVIQVHQHGSQHDEPGFFPFFSKKDPGNKAGC